MNFKKITDASASQPPAVISLLELLNLSYNNIVYFKL